MKKLNLKYPAIVILLVISSAVYSQYDSNKIYYTNDMLIEYKDGFKRYVNFKGDVISMVPNLITFNDISKIRFLSDSLISVSNQQSSDLKLKINGINKIGIKTGTQSLKGTLIGIGLGIVGGGLLGYAFGKSTEEENPVKGWFYIDPGGIGAAAGVLFGAIIGGITGNITGRNSNSYDTFYMHKNTLDKKSELKRILRIDKNKKGS